MAVYSLSQNEIHQNVINVPPALSDYISHDDYTYICHRFRGVEREAYCLATLISLALCLFFSPLALLICPCLVVYLIASERRRIAGQLNVKFFRGFQVIEAHQNNGILIHTDRIPGAVPTVFAPVAYVHQNQPVMVSNEYVHVQPAATVAAPASAYAPNTVTKNDNYTTSPMGQYAVAAVSASPPRMMSVQLPANVSPGQQLRIQSPEGTLFDITVPPGMSGGENILVPY